MRCYVILIDLKGLLLWILSNITLNLIIPLMKSFVLWLIICRFTYLLKNKGFGEGVFFISNSDLENLVLVRYP
jgi:hypothetical protein